MFQKCGTFSLASGPGAPASAWFALSANASQYAGWLMLPAKNRRIRTTSVACRTRPRGVRGTNSDPSQLNIEPTTDENVRWAINKKWKRSAFYGIRLCTAAEYPNGAALFMQHARRRPGSRFVEDDPSGKAAALLGLLRSNALDLGHVESPERADRPHDLEDVGDLPDALVPHELGGLFLQLALQERPVLRLIRDGRHGLLSPLRDDLRDAVPD